MHAFLRFAKAWDTGELVLLCDLCRTPGACRVRCVGNRTEECSVRVSLPGRFYSLSFALPVFRESGKDSGDANSSKIVHWRLYGIAFLLFVGALLSKTVTCSLPAAVLIIEWWKTGRVTKQTVLLMLPFFVTGLLLGLNTAALEKAHVGADGDEFDWTFAERVQIAGGALWMYFWTLVCPTRLTFFYPKWELDPAKIFLLDCARHRILASGWTVTFFTPHRSRATCGDSLLWRHATSGARILYLFPTPLRIFC